MTRKRDGLELLRALEESEAMDDLEEIDALSDEELDAKIRAAGGDPEAIRARGKAFAEAQLAKREASRGMLERLEAFRAEAATASRSGGPVLPRAALLARLEQARQDPRFATPVAMLFRQKSAEASTDAELQALVESLELLSKLEEA
jgi:hypothetical protein